MTIFTLVTFGLSVFSTLISCAAAVISYVYSRKPASIQMQQQVDDMMAVMEKLLKDTRREKMRNVRAASKDIDNGDSIVPVSDLGSQGAPPDKKTALRQRLQQLKGIK